MAAVASLALGGSAVHANPRPVAAYSFDEGSGATVSDSAGGHDGTIEGATWANSGKYGSALEFDGEDDLVSIAHAADLDLTDSFTLEAWVKPDTLPLLSPVVAKMVSSEGNYYGYALDARGLGEGPAGFVADGIYVGTGAESPLPTEEWTHLAYTSDGMTLSLFVDGKLDNSKLAMDAASTETALEIGHSAAIAGTYFDGQIDEVRIYDEPLSQAQIETDRDTAVGLDQIPVAAYSFDEGSGTTLGDSVGDHDGTIEGATWTSNGKYGSALSFDGEDDLVSIADAADLDLTDSFTLEAWVRPEDFSSARPVLSKAENPGTGVSGYQLEGTSAGNPLGRVANSGTIKGVEGTESLPTNEAWSHLAFTSDGTTLRLYVDGELLQSAEGIGTLDTEATLKIGKGVGGWFKGLIDEVRIYDEVLSKPRIQTDRDTRVEPPPPTEVTTTALDTGPSSELVESVPITGEGEETTAYSLEVPSLEAGEILRVTANLELTNDQAYDVTDSVRVVLGSDETDANGEVVVPWSSITHTPEMRHWTFPIGGTYHATEELGTQYLKVIVKAQSEEAEASDTLILQQNFGSLEAVRSTPAPGPMSQPTHRVQPQVDPLPQLETSLPVDSSWHRVMTRKVDELSADDILDIASQVEVQNTSGATVKLEAQLTRTMQPSTGGSSVSLPTADILTDEMELIRISLGNALRIDDPAERFINLRLRAWPVSGSAQPLTITAYRGRLDGLHFTPSPGDPTAALRSGTREGYPSWDATKEVSSIPFAVPGGSEKRVVASRGFGSPHKGTIIRARGLITGDLGTTTEDTQVLTRLILADGPTDTEGETIGVFSGDKVRPSAQIHTSIKEGTFVIPQTKYGGKYVNFVVYASQVNPSGSMSVTNASVSYTRTQPTRPLNEGFEDGLDTDGLDSVYEFEFDGTLSASTDVAREGNRSLLIDVDPSTFPKSFPGRRAEARPPDLRASGGYVGGESWYGFSVYFPDEFVLPRPDPPNFNGLIDEVRIYDSSLSTADIANDMAGNYSQTPNPVAAYGFEEGAGNIANDSAGNHHGSIDGATWEPNGKIGSALDFDGLDDEVRVPDSSDLDLTGSFTLEAWIRPTTRFSWNVLMSKVENTLGNLSGWGLNAAAWSRPRGFTADSSAADVLAPSDAQLPWDGTWSHLALTYDGTDLRLYVAGLEVATRTGSHAAATSSDLTIGAGDTPRIDGSGNRGSHYIFTQWRAPGPASENCLKSVAPSIAYKARYYKAGAYTNPGESETATPTDGDYLEMRFEGGEYNPECTAAKSSNYVLGKLERNRWYDFVQRARWDYLEESSGPSAIEVWSDIAEEGTLQQVLGDQSTPVTTPTLAWHGTPDMHLTYTYPQFGLYGFDSFDNPAMKAYIDAVRSGNSCDEVAPGQGQDPCGLQP